MTVLDVAPVAYPEQRVPEDAGRGTHCREKSNGYPHAEPQEAEAYLKQYVEALRGEPARQHTLHAACWLVAAAYRRLQ